jgi:hypothetical protein
MKQCRGSDDLPTKDLTNALVAEADTESGHASGKLPNDIA